MGTRHLTIVQLNNEYKVAQYGQWDGYPGGQGKVVHRFLKTADLNKFKEQLKKVRFVDAEEMKKMYEETGAKIDNDGWILISDAQKFKNRFPQLDRDMGANVLQYILNTTDDEILLENAITFAGDSLFCEWAWLVNLDTEELEVYTGFNKEPLPDGSRFKGIKKLEDNTKYYEISLLHSFKISELPEEKEFVQFLEELSREKEEIE